MTDVGNYPFLKAKHFYTGRQRKIRLIVLHTMESPEKGTTAEDVARYFQNIDREASAHLCIDNNSIVRCVHDADTAFAAKSANADGLHIEHAGKAGQSDEQWDDAYSRATLGLSAKAAAAWARAYDIPVRRLTPAQIKAGERGFCGHNDVQAAYPSSGHYDPGPNFPWTEYLQAVRTYLGIAPTTTTQGEFIVASKDEVKALLDEQTLAITGGTRQRDENGNVIDPNPRLVSNADLYTAVEGLRSEVAALRAEVAAK